MIRLCPLPITVKSHRIGPCRSARSGRPRLFAAAGLAVLLSACATSTHRPQMPVAQEAENYRQHARSYYAPPGPPEDPWGPYILEASKRFDVPTTWIRAVMMQESGGKLYDRHGRFVTSAPGAMGLMQLMPPTYDDLRAQYNLGSDAYDPHDNIMAGTAYIRQMYDIYGSPGFLAAYNDGPGSLDSYLRRGRVLPRETRHYVARIGPRIAGTSPHNRSSADLLVARYDPHGAPMVAQADPQVARIRAAWRRQARSTALPTYGQNVQVAEAPLTGDASARTTRAYHGLIVVPETKLARYRAGQSSRCVSANRAAPCKPTHNAYARGAGDQNAYARTSARPIPIGRHLRAQPIINFAPQRRALKRSAPSDTWAIQVGAYKSVAQATRAVAAAHAHARRSLEGAHAIVSPVKALHKHFYRARLTHLSRAHAVAACRKMGRATPCVVISPKSTL